VLAEVFDGGYGASVWKAIAKVAPPTLRFLHIGDFPPGEPQISWMEVGSIAPLYTALPDVETVIVQGAAIDFGKQVDLPRVRHLEVRTGGLSKAAARALSASKLPSLETLVVWFGDKDYGATAALADIAGLLDGKQLPNLRHLALANCEFGNDIAAALGTAKITKQLRTLDLSMSSLDDEGARALDDSKKSLKHLETLDLGECHLTPAGARLVKGLAKQVVVDDQREPYDWDETKRRYVRIGE
jgi:hypothetical protein